jgi:hypothetical protein
MTKPRPIEGKDLEAVRSMTEGTGAFKPHEVDVAMELVDVATLSGLVAAATSISGEFGVRLILKGFD